MTQVHLNEYISNLYSHHQYTAYENILTLYHTHGVAKHVIQQLPLQSYTQYEVQGK